METQMLCRICFEMGHFCLNGYEVNVQGDNISIEKMIQRFSDIELVDGNAPEMICETCTHDLVQSYVFVDKIQQADARILSSFYTQPQEPPIVYEEEVLSQKDLEEEEEVNQSPQEAEERFTDEEGNITEDNTNSNVVEEIYFDGESTEENNDIITEIHPENRLYTKAPQEGFVSLLSNYKIIKAEPDEPKRKVYCKRKGKRIKEVDGSACFVITQFTSSAASKMQLENMIPDDTDDVTLSDVRTMNFETVEVKADNMSSVNDTDQSELPIDETRVYLCQFCPKAFSSSSFLVAHVRKSHGCKYCAKMFEKTTELYEHIREAHKSFKCVVCEKEFVSNSNMRNHMKTIHKLKVPANVSLLSYKKQTNDACVKKKEIA